MSVKTAVILAAGMGSRLQDITKNEVPKGLFKIEGKSLIERSVEKLRCLGIEKIYIVTGYLSELYEEFAKDKSYIHIFKNRKYKATGSMTSLAILENELKEATTLKEEAKAAHSLADKRIKEMKVEARKIKEEAENQALEVRKEILLKAEEEAQAKKDKALRDIEKQKLEAQEDIHREIVGVALLAAQKIVEREIDEKDNTRLVEDFIKDVKN